MRVLILLSACALVACAGGCGEDGATTAPGTGELVTYARTGGVASMPVRLVISDGGEATIEFGVDVNASPISFALGAPELESLRADLEAAEFDAVEQPPEPTMCADCFAYEIIYDGDTTSYDETASVPESVGAVVSHLDEITGAHGPTR
ncbi:MAG: hypothetical protein QOI10_2859 [Solirubrobacterales bacterium]|jgi:hypothetical protein|nr:hypothetical protein [Solirubrobacterales bacterium]